MKTEAEQTFVRFNCIFITLIIFQAFVCPFWSSLNLEELKCILLTVRSDGARESGFNSSSDIPPGTTSAWKINIKWVFDIFFLVNKLKNVQIRVKNSSRHFTFLNQLSQWMRGKKYDQPSLLIFTNKNAM